MGNATSIVWPKVAVLSTLVVTRGQRIKTERNRRGLTQAELASQSKVVSERQLGRIENNKLKGDDTAKVVLVEEFLGLSAYEPPAAPPEATYLPPRIDRATWRQLVMEMLHRLDQGQEPGVLPEGIQDESDFIPGSVDPKRGEGLGSDGFG